MGSTGDWASALTASGLRAPKSCWTALRIQIFLTLPLEFSFPRTPWRSSALSPTISTRNMGRASGGIGDVVTKSGTNSFHGSAWEYNRVSAYTANTFDNDSNGVPKGQYTRNQFGYEVGGPAIKNKLYFYQSTEFLRVRSAASVLTDVPTPQFLGLTSANVQDFFTAYGKQNFNFVSTVAKTTLCQPSGTPPPCLAQMLPHRSSVPRLGTQAARSRVCRMGPPSSDW